eukprot:6305955-Pyramimonas_sp.AAC.2
MDVTGVEGAYDSHVLLVGDGKVRLDLLRVGHAHLRAGAGAGAGVLARPARGAARGARVRGPGGVGTEGVVSVSTPLCGS